MIFRSRQGKSNDEFDIRKEPASACAIPTKIVRHDAHVYTGRSSAGDVKSKRSTQSESKTYYGNFGIRPLPFKQVS